MMVMLQKNCLWISFFISLEIIVSSIVYVPPIRGGIPATATFNPQRTLQWKRDPGIPGNTPTTQPRVCDIGLGKDYIAIGTDLVFALLDGQNFSVISSAMTHGPVIDFEMLGDLDQDGWKDFALVVDDQAHPNILAISSINGSLLWQYAPHAETTNSESLETETFTTRSWDICLVGDQDGDGMSDLAITSWCAIVVVTSATGGVLWNRGGDFKSDLWTLSYLGSGSAFEGGILLAGSAEGLAKAFLAKTGAPLWTFQIPRSSISVSAGGGNHLYLIVHSIDDLLPVMDVNNDGIQDVLVAGSDGITRLLSGGSGVLLGDLSVLASGVFEVPWALASAPDPSPFTVEQRIYKDFGLTLETLDDIDLDGNAEFFALAKGLQYTYENPEYVPPMHGTVFRIITGGTPAIVPVASYEWFAATSFHASRPAIAAGSSSGIRIFFNAPKEGMNLTDNLLVQQGANWNELGISTPDTLWDAIMVGTVPGGAAGLKTNKEGNYLCFLGAGRNLEVFMACKDGRFTVLSAINGSVMWHKMISSGQVELRPIQDLNGDTRPDLLFIKRDAFRPEWGSNYYITTGDQGTYVTILAAISPTTGCPIWTWQPPSLALYDGLQDFKAVGDVTGDGITDYVAWILPSLLPPAIEASIRRFAPYNYYLGSYSYDIMRTALANYTRLIVIDGQTGTTFWDVPLTTMVYQFAHSTYHSGTYENPTNQDSGKYRFTNRVPGQMPAHWFTIPGYNEYNYTMNWKQMWDYATLVHPTEMQVVAGFAEGSIGGANNMGDGMNITLEAENEGGTWYAISNWIIPSGLGESTGLGVLNSSLSERSRFSGLKIQSLVSLNRSITGAGFSYALFNFTSQTWVECNWSGSSTWSPSIPSLQGNFTHVSDGGFRSSPGNFDFVIDQYRNDSMYVVARGTNDADPAVLFDYENSTVLSHFLDNQGCVKVQINISAADPFNASFDCLGIAAFEWGLFSPAFDQYYLINYLAAGGPRLSATHVLDQRVQAFEVINGTGDECEDLVVCIGVESKLPAHPISSRLILFDLKNHVRYERWSLNSSLIPRDPVAISRINSSMHAWGISGKFGYDQQFRTIIDPRWDAAISPLANYSEVASRINYGTIAAAGYSSEVTRVINVTTRGDQAILVGQAYPLWGGRPLSMQVVNLTSLEILCTIPVANTTVTAFRYYTSATRVPLGEVYQARWSAADFNQDGVLDHMLVNEISQPNGTFQTDIVVYSGRVAGGGTELLFNKSTSGLARSSDLLGDIPWPGCVGKDMTGDQIPDLFLGFQDQVSASGGGGTWLEGYDIHGSLPNFPLSLGGTPWILAKSARYIAGGTAFPRTMGLVHNTTGGFSSILYLSRDIPRRSSLNYYPHGVTEFVDVNSQKVVFQVEGLVNDTCLLGDLNTDGAPEMTVAVKGGLLCINGLLRVNIQSPSAGETLTTRELHLSWIGEGDVGHVEVFVDGLRYRDVVGNSTRLSLGSGSRSIVVVAHDSSEWVTTWAQLDVVVPDSAHDFLLPLVFIIAINIVILAVLQSYQLKKAQRTLIPRGKKLVDLEVMRHPDSGIGHNEERDTIISLDGLTKEYPTRRKAYPVIAVDGISLKIPPGSHGLLGPNGAGKTTLFNLLVGALKITRGEVHICGLPAGSLGALKLIGYLPQNPAFPGRWTGEDYLVYIGGLGGMARRAAKIRAQELLDYLQLWDARDRQIQAYSGGMRQKLGIAAALINSPQILLLDEPTADLDNEGKVEIIQIVKELAPFITIFVSSHALPEIEQMCTHITLINHGKIVETGSLTALKRKYSGLKITIETSMNSQALPIIRNVPGVKDAALDLQTGAIIVTPHSPEDLSGLQVEIPRAIAGAKIALQRFIPEELSLERLYFEIKRVHEQIDDKGVNINAETFREDA